MRTFFSLFLRRRRRGIEEAMPGMRSHEVSKGKGEEESKEVSILSFFPGVNLPTKTRETLNNSFLLSSFYCSYSL
jgi:hypothetical protein